MLLRAFAKINLDLRILGRRDDGYHEIHTILQTIDWCDEIRVELANRFEFSATAGPDDETNLVVRAVRAYEQATGATVNARIHLTKNIPIGRGLGGGSADAAVTVMGLQRLLKPSPCPLLEGDGMLRALRGLGSDVPFFAIGGRAAGFGRGDEVVPLEESSDYWLVLIDPGINIATTEAYSWLTISAKSNTIEGFCEEDVSGRETEQPGNAFEIPVFERYPEAAEIKNELVRLGAWRAALSGSGSTVFGQFRSESQALQAAAALDGRFRAKVTKPLPRSEYFQRMVED